MIKAIELNNFGSHKDSKLGFSPGVNIVVGMSDSGKTSILRGLRWVKDNRPSGDSIISHWNMNEKGENTGDTSVNVCVDDMSVVRLKSSDFNGYETYTDESADAGAPEESFSAVGKDVPGTISDILNIDDVNFQKQHDVPFLLSESNAEVARYFNQIVNLENIDKVLSKAESMRRSLNAGIKDNTERLTELEESVNNFGWIDEAYKMCESIRAREEKISVLRGKFDNITSTLAAIKAYRETMSRLDFTEDAKDRVEKIGEKKDESVELNFKYTKINQTSLEIIANEEFVANANNALRAKKVVESIQKIVAKVGEEKESAGKLKTLCDDIVQNEDFIIPTAAKTIKELSAELPDVCPLCGGKI